MVAVADQQAPGYSHLQTLLLPDTPIPPSLPETYSWIGPGYKVPLLLELPLWGTGWSPTVTELDSPFLVWSELESGTSQEPRPLAINGPGHRLWSLTLLWLGRGAVR